jgi:hypothetical protein
VEKYQGRPFALLGVNTDADREAVRGVVARQGINWRSWWAGGPDGEIPSSWQVAGYPSLYVIDARGVIRYEHIHPGPDLERAIDALLREVR